MANVEHKNLPEAELHEVKGASTATDGQVLVADGGGSAAFESQNPSYAQGYTDNNVTATTISAVDTFTALNHGGGCVQDIVNDFTVGSNGLFTYTGAEDRVFLVTAELTAEQTAGATKEYEYRWAKNGTTEVASHAHIITDGTDPNNATVAGIFSLSQNDTLQLYAANRTDATNVTLLDFAAQIIQLGF